MNAFNNMKPQLQTILVLSIVLTCICPPFGIVPLIYSVKAWTSVQNNCDSSQKATEKAHHWAVYCAYALVFTWLASIVAVIIMLDSLR